MCRSSGVIQHGLNLTSVYSHFLPQRGRPEVTTMPMGLGATVDYIFYSAKPVEKGNRGGECGSAGLIPVMLGEGCEACQNAAQHWAVHFIKLGWIYRV